MSPAAKKKTARAAAPFQNPYLDEYLSPPNHEEMAELRHRQYAVIDSWTLEHLRRDRLTAQYAWAIPTEAVIRALALYSPICELGCGTGYWAHLLHQAGANVIAVDDAPPKTHENRYHIKIQYMSITKADARTFKVPTRCTLMLCWPPMSRWPSNSSMASDALSRYRGKRVIYVGEGMGGCTGDDAFHEALAKKWKLVKRHVIPQWRGVHDAVYVYERRPRRERS